MLQLFERGCHDVPSYLLFRRSRSILRIEIRTGSGPEFCSAGGATVSGFIFFADCESLLTLTSCGFRVCSPLDIRGRLLTVSLVGTATGGCGFDSCTLAECLISLLVFDDAESLRCNVVTEWCRLSDVELTTSFIGTFIVVLWMASFVLWSGRFGWGFSFSGNIASYVDRSP